MPKINRRFAGSAPPVDWLWAVYLERKKVYGLSSKDMAKIAGVGYDSMRALEMKTPWTWQPDIRERVCRHLGIVISVVPTENNGIEVKIA